MSKVSSVDYPSYTGSSISIGDSNAQTKLLNGILSTNYNMSDNEADIYNYALSTLANILPQLNTFSTDTQSSIQSQLDAYKNQGVDAINQTYTPIISDLKNDIASRFGNLDNSIFNEDINDIESKRSDAVSAFAQDVLAKQSELQNDELNRRYALAQFLSGMSDNIYSNALSTINTALGGSSNVNNYNNNLYNALSKQYLSNNSSNSNLSSALSNALGLSNTSSLFSFL